MRGEPQLRLWAPPILVAGGIFALSSIPGDRYPSHPGWLNPLMHLLEYLLLGFFLTRALAETRVGKDGPVALSILFCVIYALGDELHQWTIPSRVFDSADLLVDFLGAGAGSILHRSWSRSRRPPPGNFPAQPPANGPGGR